MCEVDIEEFAEKLLRTYSLEEILEINDLQNLEVILFLIKAGLIDLDMATEL